MQASETITKNLSFSQAQAFINLLSDSDERTTKLLAKQMMAFDDASLTLLEKLANSSENETLLDNWYYISKISLIEKLQNWKREGDLEEGLFLIARIKNPGLEINNYDRIIDNFTERIKKSITIESNPDEIMAAIGKVLFEEEGFVGNQLDYYDLNNNFIHTVIERRAGNPIMLSCLFLMIARRLELDIEGVAMPGHFIVKFKNKFYDPFFAGREISREECILRAQELRVYWREDYLNPVDDNFVLARCIRNLITIYKKLNDYDRAADISSLLKLV
ncbi:MAG: transglutaminase-like domain-containing protein [Candidatus Caenarcaniphilales bacterium]|jgi:regulator of sirC expression with transglutaminase-like and TPR domain|nr:transglutaminase-like domain-containing protein [Candidatus Caenarcaniphilales bacterium]